MSCPVGGSARNCPGPKGADVEGASSRAPDIVERCSQKLDLKSTVDRHTMVSNRNCSSFSPPMGNSPLRASPKLYEDIIILIHFASVGRTMSVHEGSVVMGARHSVGADAAMCRQLHELIC